MQNFSDFIMKCAIFEEHSSSCVVYSRFSGTLFPVSMIDGADAILILSLHCLFPQTYLRFMLHSTLLSSSQIKPFGDERTHCSA